MSLSLFVPLEPLVNKEHAYRKFLQLLDFEWLIKPLLALENTEVGSAWLYPIQRIPDVIITVRERFKCSRIGKLLQKNLAAKLFCSFSLESLRL